jgi:hypothetical protein
MSRWSIYRETLRTDGRVTRRSPHVGRIFVAVILILASTLRTYGAELVKLSCAGLVIVVDPGSRTVGSVENLDWQKPYFSSHLNQVPDFSDSWLELDISTVVRSLPDRYAERLRINRRTLAWTESTTIHGNPLVPDQNTTKSGLCKMERITTQGF